MGTTRPDDLPDVVAGRGRLRRLGRRDVWWVWMLVGGCGLIALFVSPLLAPLGQWGYFLPQLTALAGMFVGLWLHRPRRAAPWLLMVTATVVLTGSELGLIAALAGRAPRELADAGFLVAAVLVMSASLLFAWRSALQRDREELLDSAIVAVGLALVLWQYLPLRPASGLSLTTQLSQLAYPMVLLVMTAVHARLLVGRAGHLVSARLLALSGFAGLAGSLWFVFQQQDGTWVLRGGVDVLVLLAQVCAAAAMLHPSMRALSDEVLLNRSRRTPLTQLAVLGLALVCAPLVVTAVARTVREQPEFFTVSLSAFMLFGLVGLVFWRLVTLLSERDRAQRAMELSADRRALVAILGRRALDREQPRRLAQDAVGEIARLLDVEHAAVIDHALDDGTFRVVCHRGWATPSADGRIDVPPESLIVQSLSTNEPVVSTDRPGAVAADRRLVGTRALAAGVAVLIGSPKRPLGVLVAHSERARVFTAAEREFLESVANVIAAAVIDKHAQEERQLLMRTMVSAAEQERARVAADLHDGPIQQLAALSMRLRVVRNRLTRGAGTKEIQAGKDLGQLEDDLSEEVRRLRRVMTELRPATLDDHGLVPALKLQAELFEKTTKNPCTVNVRGLAGGHDARLPLDRNQETVLYRVVQEALTNVRKHARAKHAWVQLEVAEERVVLRVGDDGVGFTPPSEEERARKRDEHVGLVWMRERVRMVDGRWSITSARGRGTTIQVELDVARRGGRHRQPQT